MSYVRRWWAARQGARTARVLAAITDTAPLSALEVAQRTRMSVGAVSVILIRLWQDGQVASAWDGPARPSGACCRRYWKADR